VAAVVESNHDENGIVWPVSVAPYEVVLTVVRVDDTATMATANQLYEMFSHAGVEVLLDDREERPGVKFADAELVGIPYRVTIGPKGVAEGIAEVTERRGMVRSDVPLDTVVTTISEKVFAARHGISG
jgi:prolyl-tRNA synthetase